MRQQLIRAALVLVLSLAAVGFVFNLVAAVAVGPDGQVTMEQRAGSPGIVTLHDPVLRSGGAPLSVTATSDPPGQLWLGEIYETDLGEFEKRAPGTSITGVSRWGTNLESTPLTGGTPPPVGEGIHWLRAETGNPLVFTHSPGQAEQALVIRPIDGTGPTAKPADRGVVLTLTWTNAARFWTPAAWAVGCLILALAAGFALVRGRFATSAAPSSAAAASEKQVFEKSGPDSSAFAVAPASRRGSRQHREKVRGRAGRRRTHSEPTGSNDVIDATTAPVRTHPAAHAEQEVVGAVRHAAPGYSNPFVSKQDDDVATAPVQRPSRPSFEAFSRTGPHSTVSGSLPVVHDSPTEGTVITETGRKTGPHKKLAAHTDPSLRVNLGGYQRSDEAEPSSPVASPFSSGEKTAERTRPRSQTPDGETQSLRVSIPSSGRVGHSEHSLGERTRARSLWESVGGAGATNPFASLRASGDASTRASGDASTRASGYASTRASGENRADSSREDSGHDSRPERGSASGESSTRPHGSDPA